MGQSLLGVFDGELDEELGEGLRGGLGGGSDNGGRLLVVIGQRVVGWLDGLSSRTRPGGRGGSS